MTWCFAHPPLLLVPLFLHSTWLDFAYLGLPIKCCVFANPVAFRMLSMTRVEEDVVLQWRLAL